MKSTGIKAPTAQPNGCMRAYSTTTTKASMYTQLYCILLYIIVYYCILLYIIVYYTSNRIQEALFMRFYIRYTQLQGVNMHN